MESFHLTLSRSTCLLLRNNWDLCHPVTMAKSIETRWKFPVGITHTHTCRHTEISTEQHTMEKCQTDLIWYFRYIWFFSSLFRWCTKNRLSVFCSTIFDAPLCFAINCKIFLPLKKLIGWNSSKSFSTLLLLYPLLGVSVSVMEYFTLEAFRHRKNQFIKWTNPFPYVLSTISSIAKFWNSWPILMIILIFR